LLFRRKDRSNFWLNCCWFFCFSSIARGLGPVCGAVLDGVLGIDAVGLVSAIAIITSMILMLGVSIRSDDGGLTTITDSNQTAKLELKGADLEEPLLQRGNY